MHLTRDSNRSLHPLKRTKVYLPPTVRGTCHGQQRCQYHEQHTVGQNAMAALDPSPSYRTCCIDNGYISNWDHDWRYRFRISGYTRIEWLEIPCKTEQEIRNVLNVLNVLNALKKIHIPGEATPAGFISYGHIEAGY